MGNSFTVIDDSKKIEGRVEIIRRDLVTDKDSIRHDPKKIVGIIPDIYYGRMSRTK